MGLSSAIVVTALGSTLMQCAWVVQKTAVTGMPKIEAAKGIDNVRLLVTSRTWLWGFLMLIGGFGLYQFALAETGQVSVLQPIGGAGLALLALLAVLFLKEHLGRSEWISLIALIVGIIALGLSAEKHEREFSGPALAGLLVTAALIAAAVLAARRFLVRAVPLESLVAAASGLAQGLGLILMAEFGHLTEEGQPITGSLLLAVALACYSLNLLLIQRGFQEGRATVVIAISTAVTNAVAIVGGIAVLGESLPESDYLAGVQVAALITIILASLPLARLGAPEPGHSTAGSTPDMRPM
jgi:drug/metabolite transporter (DMT)-like permease